MTASGMETAVSPVPTMGQDSAQTPADISSPLSLNTGFQLGSLKP